MQMYRCLVPHHQPHYLPLLQMRPNIKQIRKCAPALHMQPPICLRNFSRINHLLRRYILPKIGAPRKMDRPVDIRPRNMHTLGPKFLGQR